MAKGQGKRHNTRAEGYREEFADQVYTLCLLGATEAILAEFFGVTVDAITKWKQSQPIFAKALRMGRVQADIRVAEALYSRAIGYKWSEQQAFKVKDVDGNERVEVVSVERQVPPDTGACAFWLKNRRKDAWRDRGFDGSDDPNAMPHEATVVFVGMRGGNGKLIEGSAQEVADSEPQLVLRKNGAAGNGHAG